MATRKKNIESESDNQISDISLSGTIGAESITTKITEVKEISLNQKAEAFFGVAGIWLTHENYSAEIPKNISASDAKVIQRALDAGIIVEGNRYICPVDRDENVLEDYWHLIKSFGLDTTNSKSESTIAFRKLFKTGIDRNWTAKEVANFCIERETKYKNRDRIIKLLKELHKFSGCPDTLLEKK